MMSGYEYIQGKHAGIKAWTKGVLVEDAALQQLKNLASLPFIHSHVAAMPDVHWGRGATVGSVIATKGAIVPAAVGVDIGCGMIAAQSTLNARQLPDNLFDIRSDIENAVPHGRTNNGGAHDRGAWGDIPDAPACSWADLEDRYNGIVAKHPKAISRNNARHLATLGTGNHFIELCLDEDEQVWVMLHSGSRGVGNRIGTYFIDLAKKEMEKYFIGAYLPDKDLSYLVEKTEIFDDYVEAVDWAQTYAAVNRELMLSAVVKVLKKRFKQFKLTEIAVNCHHNYVAKENHFGANVYVTRKGAVRAREGDLGIIPGSMGAKSYIVRGKGNQDAFCSCSHGAGRSMSRGEARRRITLKEHREATKGVECRKDREVLDESPAAYKSIDAVMAAQQDLVEIVHTLKQVVNVKG